MVVVRGVETVDEDLAVVAAGRNVVALVVDGNLVDGHCVRLQGLGLDVVALVVQHVDATPVRAQAEELKEIIIMSFMKNTTILNILYFYRLNILYFYVSEHSIYRVFKLLINIAFAARFRSHEFEKNV